MYCFLVIMVGARYIHMQLAIILCDLVGFFVVSLYPKRVVLLLHAILIPMLMLV